MVFISFLRGACAPLEHPGTKPKIETVRRYHTSPWFKLSLLGRAVIYVGRSLRWDRDFYHQQEY